MSISNNATGLRPGVCTSTTRPTSPYLGQLIFETDTFTLKYWNGSSWQGAISAPAGTVNTFAGSTAPTGWLPCAGQAVSRTTYADLFAAISTTYGTGDGSTTFNLPDLRGRTVFGRDDMNGSAANRVTSAVSGITGTSLGAAGGDQNIHGHSHANTATFSGSSGTTGNDSPDHSHLTFTQSISASLTAGPNGTFVYNPGTGASSSGASTRHTHSFTPAGTVSMSNATTGTGTSQNMPPTMIMNYIIKT